MTTENTNTANSVEKNYNFDEIIDRHHTDAIKIERCKALFGSSDNFVASTLMYCVLIPSANTKSIGLPVVGVA